MVNSWSMPENLDQFRRMLVYRGAGLGRFHCTCIILLCTSTDYKYR